MTIHSFTVFHNITGPHALVVIEHGLNKSVATDEILQKRTRDYAALRTNLQKNSVTSLDE